jgi:hypothetical protein
MFSGMNHNSGTRRVCGACKDCGFEENKMNKKTSCRQFLAESAGATLAAEAM